MNGVKIRSISFKSFKCFEDMEIDCRKDKSTLYQWTVLLGNNNTGKTSLLRAIAGLRPKRIRLVRKGSKEVNDLIPAFFYECLEKNIYRKRIAKDVSWKMCIFRTVCQSEKLIYGDRSF